MAGQGDITSCWLNREPSVLRCDHCFVRSCACWRSDEIYANSVFKEAQFVSLATILDQSSPALQEKGRLLVHTVFGLSKDW